MLDGVFSIMLYDHDQQSLFIANDPIGIRPLYYGNLTNQKGLVYASEPHALKNIANNIQHFAPGTYQIFRYMDKTWQLLSQDRYYDYDWSFPNESNENENENLVEIYQNYRSLLTQAVEKRLMGDRPIATLLSGGLDSSLISMLTAKLMKKKGLGPLHTFSIGLLGSPDLKHAQEVADYIGSIHHSVVVTEEEFLACIPEVINAIQSYDITTVRASCGNYLIAKYIRENTDFKIILNGDVSEEIHASYFYSRFAPNDGEFFKDNVRLLKEVHRYDVLRSARCIEHFGMECRTPFADKELINFVMSIHPKYKRCGPDSIFPMEKMLLRMSFHGELPTSVLYRPKVAFSDGISKKTKSWHQIIQEHVATTFGEENYQATIDLESKNNIYFSMNQQRESVYYRYLFYKSMGGFRLDLLNLIPGYWMPRFIESNDPSARTIGSKD